MTSAAIPPDAVPVPEVDVEAVLDALRSGWLTMGPRIQQLEAALADRLATPHAVAVSSGTAALQLALLAVGTGPGDEVVVPALAFPGAVAAVRCTGAEPVLCDVRGLHDLTLDPADVAARITPRTKAVVAVHLFGFAADVAALRALCHARGVALVEDAAHALGAHLPDGALAGTAGDAGCFSLAAGRQVAVGEGGFVTAREEAIAARVRSLRSHAMTSVTWDRHRGHANTYDIVDVGFNYRLDEPRAALALAQLPRLEAAIAHRRALARAYRERLADVPGVALPWDEDAVARGAHLHCPIVLADERARDALHARLAAESVASCAYPSIGALSAHRELGSPPRAAEAAARHLLLPLSAAMGEADVATVAAVVRRALA